MLKSIITLTIIISTNAVFVNQSERESSANMIHASISKEKELDKEKREGSVYRMAGSSRIINGRPVDISDHPWAVFISINSHICGGSIIGRKLVVTARHCVQRVKRGKVVYGQTNRSETRHAISFANRHILFHKYVYVDVAIIKLGRSIKYSSAAGPIDLPWGPGFPRKKEEMYVVGWGYICDDGIDCTRQSTLPKLVQELIITRKGDSCITDELVRVTGFGPKQKQTLFCAGGRDSKGFKSDACSGDSGGPVECNINSKRRILCGIVAAGDEPDDCGVRPGAYTKTSVPFILEFLRSGGRSYGRNATKVANRVKAYKHNSKDGDMNTRLGIIVSIAMLFCIK